MAPDGREAVQPLPEDPLSTSESQSAYDDLQRLIPELTAELEMLRTSLREHSLWLLRYGHTDKRPTATTSQTTAAGQDPTSAGPSGTAAGQLPGADHRPGQQHQQCYIEPRPILRRPGPQQAHSESGAASAQLPPPPPPPPASQDAELPGYSASDVPPYTGALGTVSASTREEVRRRSDQLAEWLGEGEDVLREYSARFAQLAARLGQPHEDLLGTWRDANPDNALPDYQRIEEREELMVGGVGDVPPPYLPDSQPYGGDGPGKAGQEQ